MSSIQHLPATSAQFCIEGAAGRIEIASMRPEPERELPWLAIVCHPHPLHQGTMDNKVVQSLAKAFVSQGMVSLRFNFRGVGASDGHYGEGVLEAQDLLQVIDWALAELPGYNLLLAGFSFGAFVSLSVANLRPVKQLVSIAPPVERFYFKDLPEIVCPWLVVQGEADEVISAQAVFDWIDSLQHRPELISMPGVGHFFHGRLIELREVVLKRVKPLLSAPAQDAAL